MYLFRTETICGSAFGSLLVGASYIELMPLLSSFPKFGFIGQKDLFQVANAISARIL